MKDLPIKIEPEPIWEEEPVQIESGEWIARGRVAREDGYEVVEESLTPPTSNHRPMQIEKVGWYWIPFEVQYRVPEFVSEIRFYTSSHGYYTIGYCAQHPEDVNKELDRLRFTWDGACENDDKDNAKAIEAFVIAIAGGNNTKDEIKSSFYDGIFPRLEAKLADRTFISEWPAFEPTKAVGS